MKKNTRLFCIMALALIGNLAIARFNSSPAGQIAASGSVEMTNTAISVPSLAALYIKAPASTGVVYLLYRNSSITNIILAQGLTSTVPISFFISEADLGPAFLQRNSIWVLSNGMNAVIAYELHTQVDPQ